MAESTDTDDQVLAVHEAQRRRSDVRGWFAVLGFMLLCGLTGWIITGDVAWLAVCGFLAVYPVLMLLYTLVYLLNPWVNPATPQRRLNAAILARQHAPARAALGNGILFVASSPILFIMAVMCGFDEYGLWGGVCGALIGTAWLSVGVAAIAWAKRSQ
jgi:hypothetical protein